MFVQNNQVQTVTINRTSTDITVDGVFSVANVTSTGTTACGVRQLFFIFFFFFAFSIFYALDVDIMDLDVSMYNTLSLIPR